MSTHYELELLRRRIELIEVNLSEAKTQLAVLAKQMEAPDEPVVVAQPVERPVPHVAMPVPERLVVPPPLPDAEPVYEERIVPPQEPRTPRGPVVPDVPAVETVPEWKTWLQRLQLWPPADGQNNEVRLGAWWATRLGTLLAVIGVVFFGVYVSLNTPPWVKFAELCAICGGVAGFGLWLERRIPRFGAVVFAGGLALVYFCAFAGYALPAVKVLTNPAAAVGWQLAAVMLIAAAAASRRSPTIATMAVGLGYVTAIFSRAGGLHEFALVTAALLAVAAVVFHRWQRWEAPAVVALPGAYAVYALVLQGNWLRGETPDAGWPWLFLGGVCTLFFLRDWRFSRAEKEDVGAGETWFQGMNSSLAVALGVITALTLYREDLAVFYFGAALLLGVFAALRRVQVPGDAIGAVLLAKATGAFTLGVVECVDGRTTALALLVQAWVMMFSARRLASRVLGVGAGLVALVASVYFFENASAVLPLVSWAAAGALVFVTGIAWLAAEAVRGRTDENDAIIVGVAGAFVAAAGAVVSVLHVTPTGWAPALLMGLVVVLGLPGWWRRAFAPLAASVMLLIAANGVLWQLAEGDVETLRLIMNAMAVLIPGALIVTASGSTVADGVMGRGTKYVEGIGVGAGVITLLGIAHVLGVLMAPVMVLGVMVLLAWVLGAITPVAGGRHMPWLATCAGVLGVGFWQEAGAGVIPGGWLLTAVVAAWALPVGLHVSRRHRASLESEPAAGWLVVVQVAVALLVTLKALPVYFAGATGVLAHAFAALAVFGLTRRPGIRIGLEASWVLWGAVIMGVEKLVSRQYYDFGYSDASLLAVALLAWGPAVVMTRGVGAELPKNENFAWRRRGAGVQTVIATWLALRVCMLCFAGGDLLVALVGAALVAVVMVRLARVSSARWAAVALMVCAVWASWGFVYAGRAEGWGGGLASILVVAGALVALPLALGAHAWGTQQGNRLRWAFGVAGLGLVFFAALAQRGVLDPFATVGWGLGSIIVFMTGLFARTRPYRMLGLLGLALCVPRMFFVDLDSALHRIAAFVVLGLVLLWVGFSYHRFRHLITDESDSSTSS